MDLDLNTEEWHGITSRLKEVLAHLKAQNKYASPSHWHMIDIMEHSTDE